MLTIHNLSVSLDGKPILKSLSLTVPKGETHAIMGPNGSGKSTLANILAGREGYTISGTITFENENLLDMEPEERAAKGLFLAFQYPTALPGVNGMRFLQESLNAIQKAQQKPELDLITIVKKIRNIAKQLNFDEAMLKRAVNDGFSGGEKKRNEMLHLAVLEPKMAILDETDSGLDIDALKNVAEGVNAMRNENRSFLIITHYQRLLSYIVPDKIHVLIDGQIVRSGDSKLGAELEAKGYSNIIPPTVQPQPQPQPQAHA